MVGDTTASARPARDAGAGASVFRGAYTAHKGIFLFCVGMMNRRL
jgi:hypothetical protein